MEHQEGRFQGHKNISLYYQCWLPDGRPGAVLLVAHGLADHSGRYLNLVNYFVPEGYAVYAFDYRGHGKSEGRRCYVDRFSDYLADMETFYDMVRRAIPDAKIFLVGHSVGGTISTAFAISHQPELAGLVLSAPVLKPGASITRGQITMARVLSALLPKMGVAGLDASAISQDKNVVTAYVNDPLVYHGKVCARTGTELINTIERDLPPRIDKLALPVLIMQGSEDRLSNPDGSSMLFQAVASKDKTLKRYSGFYHEIFNEPGRLQVLKDMDDWITRHL